MKCLILILITIALILNGCATTWHRTSNLSLGMTKQEVIKAMGRPTSTKAKGNMEVLEYMINPPNAPYAMAAYVTQEQYWVILENGRVTQYGKAGDFRSSERPDILIENR